MRVKLRLTHHQLATVIGTTRVTVTRLLRGQLRVTQTFRLGVAIRIPAHIGLFIRGGDWLSLCRRLARSRLSACCP
ncbi:MAG: helix-turn-helix domain-containing protein [Pseudomonadota bacterium]